MTSPANQNRQSQLVASKLGARLWRMNVGLGWIGNAKKFDKEETITVRAGDVLIKQARPFRSGIEGMSDGCGLVSEIIDGERVARFLAIEDKQGTGRLTDEQAKFIKAIRALGGYAGVARSDDDVAAIIRGEIRD